MCVLCVSDADVYHCLPICPSIDWKHLYVLCRLISRSIVCVLRSIVSQLSMPCVTNGSRINLYQSLCVLCVAWSFPMCSNQMQVVANDVVSNVVVAWCCCCCLASLTCIVPFGEWLSISPSHWPHDALDTTLINLTRSSSIRMRVLHVPCQSFKVHFTNIEFGHWSSSSHSCAISRLAN